MSALKLHNAMWAGHLGEKGGIALIRSVGELSGGDVLGCSVGGHSVAPT